MALALGSAASACSSPVITQPSLPFVPEAIHAAAPTTATAYVYVVNFATNDVSQLAFNPKWRRVFQYVGPQFHLPSGCIGPDSVAMAPSRTLLFVACSSGEIVTLAVSPKTHKLSASAIAPIPMANPLSLIAPATGKRGMLYADGYNGQLFALAYTPNSLRVAHTYAATSQYPNQMSLYTSPSGSSTLFVAAPYDRAVCGRVTAGDIIPWHQNADGSLAKQRVIPACSTAFHVLVVGNNLYWAAANFLGGYSLANKKRITMPKPRWAAANHGPGAYPDAMTLAMTLPNAAHPNGPLPTFTTSNIDGTVSLYDVNGATISTIPLRAQASVALSTPIVAAGAFGVEVDRFVFGLTSDIISTTGLSPNGKTIGFPVTPVGVQPRGLVVITAEH